LQLKLRACSRPRQNNALPLVFANGRACRKTLVVGSGCWMIGEDVFTVCRNRW
jgi:hypothetical protein